MNTLSADSQFHRQLILVNGLLPAALLVFDGWRGSLGANPVEFVTRTTGVVALFFLLLALAVTPLRQLYGWTWLLKQRRLLGLYAFFYALAHLWTYILGDRGGQLSTIAADIARRPFITLGMLSFACMVPLALTSSQAMIKQLGPKRWRQLHRLTYVVAIGGVIHYAMIVKSDLTYPALFAMVLTLLLGYRLRQVWQRG
ncbi:MAG: sulfoxide reductase heme-binding subunit YedZ [Cyanobacteria bacterium REEB459]|nr:sulfoxide reductase heme-binding subunit YedZ [Cyanobacteria bacterium REEB459]